MKRLFALGLVVCFALTFINYHQSAKSATALAQEAKQSEKKAKADSSERRKARGRLPNYYGQIGLSEEQRTQIYGIQSKYRMQLQDLQKQINELRQKQDAEISAVLTKEQSAKLEKTLADVQKRREAQKKNPQSKD